MEEERSSSYRPTEPELRFRGDLQKSTNWSHSKCEEIPSNYAQEDISNPKSEQSQEENHKNNEQEEGSVQRREPLCDCKSAAILMLLVALVSMTMLFTLPVYSSASCEGREEFFRIKYELLIQTKSAEHEKQLAQLTAELKQSEQTKTRLEDRVKQLEKDNNQLATDWKLSKQLAEERGKTVTTLERDKQEAELVRVQLQTEKTQLEGQNSKLRDEQQELKAELAEKTKTASTLEAENWRIELEAQKQTTANAVEQTRVLAEKDREYHKLSSEVKVLQSEKSTMLGENKKLEVDLTRVTSLLENLQEKQRELEEELRKYKESYNTKFWERFEVGLDRDGERLSTLMKENEKLKNAVAQAKNEIIKTDSECKGIVCRTLTSGIKNFFG